VKGERSTALFFGGARSRKEKQISSVGRRSRRELDGANIFDGIAPDLSRRRGICGKARGVQGLKCQCKGMSSLRDWRECQVGVGGSTRCKMPLLAKNRLPAQGESPSPRRRRRGQKCEITLKISHSDCHREQNHFGRTHRLIRRGSPSVSPLHSEALYARRLPGCLACPT
jgi:hypothetical protein